MKFGNKKYFKVLKPSSQNHLLLNLKFLKSLKVFIPTGLVFYSQILAWLVSDKDI